MLIQQNHLGAGLLKRENRVTRQVAPSARETAQWWTPIVRQPEPSSKV
jgi:hypothetical protein